MQCAFTTQLETVQLLNQAGKCCQALLVLMGMVHVRHVWVGMSHRLMLMKMGMRLPGWIASVVRMTVVLVMSMRMRVDHGTMDVFMLVMFSHVQPHASRH
jgi:hypothetical protein